MQNGPKKKTNITAAVRKGHRFFLTNVCLQTPAESETGWDTYLNAYLPVERPMIFSK